MGSDTNQLDFIVLLQGFHTGTYRHQETRERSFQNHLDALTSLSLNSNSNSSTVPLIMLLFDKL